MTRILFRGGYVHTPADPHATAICVEDGQVVWTGDDDASAHFVDNADQVVDLRGRLVAPAFVDAHAHLVATGLAAGSLDLGAAASVADALDRLARFARDSDAAVLMGHGWDESGWPEGRAFTRSEVDRVVGDRPAYLSRVDVHSAVASTALLDAAARVGDEPVSGLEGFSDESPLTRDAHHALRAAVQHLLPSSARRDAIRVALEQAHSRGIGMVHELGAPHISQAGDFALIESLRDERTLAEVVGYWGELSTDVAGTLGLAGAAGDLCMDGAIGSRTAALHDHYSDAQTTSGFLYLDAGQVRDHVVACTRAGLQAGFHVIGDRAATEVVEGFRLATEVVGGPALVRARHRLEHLEMVAPSDLQTLGELGVTASVQPMFDGWWGGAGELYEQRLGDRAAAMNPFVSMGRAGLALAFGSDTPVTPFDPWGAVRAAAWHHQESERMTVRAAFNAHTRGGWRAARRDEGGVIAVGAPAYLAVWDVPGDLMVQTPDSRVAAWSTDLRAGVPQLPEVRPDHDLPTCVLTLVDGAVAFDPEGVLS